MANGRHPVPVGGPCTGLNYSLKAPLAAASDGRFALPPVKVHTESLLTRMGAAFASGSQTAAEVSAMSAGARAEGERRGCAHLGSLPAPAGAATEYATRLAEEEKRTGASSCCGRSRLRGSPSRRRERRSSRLCRIRFHLVLSHDSACGPPPRPPAAAAAARCVCRRARTSCHCRFRLRRAGSVSGPARRPHPGAGKPPPPPAASSALKAAAAAAAAGAGLRKALPARTERA